MNHEYDDWDLKMFAELDAIEKKSDKILRRLKKQLPPSWFKDIQGVMSENCHNHGLEITNDHGGEKEKWASFRFKHLFGISNYCTYSDSGSGEMWIPIRNGNYLHFYYSN